jgi:hypothetical protein
MAGFSDDDALWGPTISQEMPTQYQGSPFDPAPKAIAAPPPLTPVAADAGGMDWNKIIQGISMIGLAGISAGQGDPMAGMRMMQFQQESGRRDQAMKMQQESHEMDKKKHELTMGELAIKAKARESIRSMDLEGFEKDPSGTMLKLMGPLVDLNPDSAASMLSAVAKIKGDDKAAGAAQKVGSLIQAAMEDDGNINPQKFTAGLALISDPEVTKAAKDFFPLIAEQGREKRADESNARLTQNQKDSNEKFLISQDRLRDSMAQQNAQFQQGQANQNARFNAAQAGMESRLDKRLALTEEQQRRLTPAQTKEYTGHQTAMAAINNYEASYNDLLKETKGQFSAVFKGALAKNAKAKTLAELTGVTGGTPVEQKFAAEYTALVSNLRSLTTEVGVMTDEDAVRILGSFNPAVTPGQVKANLRARHGTHERNAGAMLDSLEKTGKNVAPLRTTPTAAPAASAAPATAPASTARPRAVNKQTGETVEWDGKAWVKVK